jgi:glycosyltransferase involved in cell wall biosynthesis
VRIHQILAGASGGDAITRIALQTRSVLRTLGESEIYARHIDPTAGPFVQSIERLAEHSDPDDVLIVRASIGDEVIYPMLATRSERIFVAYHNISPPEFFAELDPTFAELLELGRRQLAELAPRVEVAWADSTFNADDLQTLGYDDVAVVPPILDPFHLTVTPPDPEFAREIAHRAPAELVLFVGQLLPHKRPDVLIGAHHLLTAHHRPDATLVLVGAHRFPDYVRQLTAYAKRFNLPRVWFTGAVTDSELGELFRRADVFATASSHEGFCVPVLEAMAASIPVVTSDAGAIPETVGDGALVLPHLTAESLAEAEDLLADGRPRAEAVLRGRTRAREMSPEAATASLRDILDRHL